MKPAKKREAAPQPLVIVGASGFGGEVAWVVQCINAATPRFELLGFCDDAPHKQDGAYCDVPLLGTIERAREKLGDSLGPIRFHCAVGDNRARQALARRALTAGWLPATIIDPRADVASSAVVGEGCYIGGLCIVSANARLGAYVLVNQHATIGHDTIIGDFAQISPGARVSGWATMGEGAWMGSNAVVLPKRKIGAWAGVGAGSVAMADLQEGSTLARLPARPPRPVVESTSAAPEPGAAADDHAKPARIFLSPPCMNGLEQEFVKQAFASNYIAPVGPMVDAFEREFAMRIGTPHALALSSGTAALHLAMIEAGVGPGDVVIAPSFSFVATIAPAVQLGATPVFIDSERDSWNMDPELLAEELARRSRRGALPKLVLAADIYGQGCDIDRIQAVCAEYGVPVIEDAAEAIGATYKGRPVGAGSAVAAFSFNGNKIITTSGGGMLLARDPAVIRHARHLATQARDPAHHYEHSELGYNYRLSNVLAAIGRGQLRSLDDFVRRRRQVFAWYQQRLADLEGISFMPEAATGCCSRWLTVVQFGAAARVSPEQVRAALEVEAIEARPVWKPMHLQPVFKGAAHVGGSVCAEFFANGLCLPSGSALTETDIDRVAEVVRACMRKDPGV